MITNDFLPCSWTHGRGKYLAKRSQKFFMSDKLAVVAGKKEGSRFSKTSCQSYLLIPVHALNVCEGDQDHHSCILNPSQASFLKAHQYHNKIFPLLTWQYTGRPAVFKRANIWKIESNSHGCSLDVLLLLFVLVRYVTYWWFLSQHQRLR